MNTTSASRSKAVSIGLVGAAILMAIVALYEVCQVFTEKADLAEIMVQYRSDHRSLQIAERNAAADAERVAESEMKRAVRRAAKSDSSDRPRDPRVDGQAFLRFGPAKALLLAVARAQIRQAYASFYKQVGLTPQEIEAFESQTAQRWLDTLLVFPGGMRPGHVDLPPDQLKAVLGDSGSEAYEDFQRAANARGWAASVAQSAADGGVPLTSDQIDVLAQALEKNSPDYAAGEGVNPLNVDWASALAKAKQNLTEAQWREAQPAILLGQVMFRAQSIQQESGN
jgi:hypothetical protein